MSAPAIIYLVLIGVSLLVSAHEHGKPRDGKYNFWTSLVSTAIGVSLLVWGGFFK